MNKKNGSCSGFGIYGFGFIGSLVYFVSTSVGFWAGLVSFFKALVWPAYMIYAIFKFLGA